MFVASLITYDLIINGENAMDQSIQMFDRFVHICGSDDIILTLSNISHFREQIQHKSLQIWDSNCTTNDPEKAIRVIRERY